ncbi:MAG: GtrA family protein [Paludibacter sp.]|nr:GtrA family protein [Bacteroidales bacterium]MCM1069911.1 GtrA family protein [Prevotella sp.]MCM1354672.1 GtrA family protein [Bacteroides sp.]MCM1443487.1 GtrA family protein [Muribaculum sp.]MCM1482592.1 GtrA family protein [Paludibacter sp.]
MSNNWWKTLQRYIEFSLSTLLGTGVDMLVLWICSDFLFKDSYIGENILSPFISFECAVLTNFVVAYFFVWKDRVTHRSVTSFFRHYAGYNLSCTSVFLIKMCFLLAIQYLSKWDVLICNLLALCFSGIFNFILNEWVIFRKKENTDYISKQ